MTTATNLSPADRLRQEAIQLQQQAKDLEKAAAENERAAQRAKRKEDQRLELIAAHKKRVDLGEALMAADTEGLLNVEYTKNNQSGVMLPCVYFMLGNSRQVVDMEKHYTNHGSKAVIKYQLCGNYSSYSRRFYTRPATVLEKIGEFIAAFNSQQAAQTKAATELEQGLVIAQNRFPDAKIETLVRYSKFGDKRYDVIVVTGTKGIVEFRAIGGEEVDLTVEAIRPNSSTKQEVADFILK